jgi:hypothetical protein
LLYVSAKNDERVSRVVIGWLRHCGGGAERDGGAQRRGRRSEWSGGADEDNLVYHLLDRPKYLAPTSIQLGGTAYSGKDLSIRNIEVRNSAPALGTEGLFDANYRTPYTIHFNGGVQRQLRRNLSISADFVMRRGVKFGANDGMYEDINRWNRFAAGYTINATTGQVLEGVNRFRNPVIPACATVLNANTPPALDPRLPSAQCSNNVIAYNQGGILSRYTALQVKLDKRFEHGFLLTAAGSKAGKATSRPWHSIGFADPYTQ